MKANSSVRKVQDAPRFGSPEAPTKRVIDLTTPELRDELKEMVTDVLTDFLSGEIKPPSEYLTRSECAELLRISTAQLDILSRRDVDPIPFEIIGESRRYVRVDVHSWVRMQRKAARSA